MVYIHKCIHRFLYLSAVSKPWSQARAAGLTTSEWPGGVHVKMLTHEDKMSKIITQWKIITESRMEPAAKSATEILEIQIEIAPQITVRFQCCWSYSSQLMQSSQSKPTFICVDVPFNMESDLLRQVRMEMQGSEVIVSAPTSTSIVW